MNFLCNNCIKKSKINFSMLSELKIAWYKEIKVNKMSTRTVFSNNETESAVSEKNIVKLKKEFVTNMSSLEAILISYASFNILCLSE